MLVTIGCDWKYRNCKQGDSKGCSMSCHRGGGLLFLPWFLGCTSHMCRSPKMDDAGSVEGSTSTFQHSRFNREICTRIWCFVYALCWTYFHGCPFIISLWNSLKYKFKHKVSATGLHACLDGIYLKWVSWQGFPIFSFDYDYFWNDSPGIIPRVACFDSRLPNSNPLPVFQPLNALPCSL